jgi:hypothetical protein
MLTGDCNFCLENCFCKNISSNNSIAKFLLLLILLLLLFLLFLLLLLFLHLLLLLLFIFLLLLISVFKIHSSLQRFFKISALEKKNLVFFPNLAISVALSRKANCVHFVLSSCSYFCDSFNVSASDFADI